jgi:hypothetical protein
MKTKIGITLAAAAFAASFAIGTAEASVNQCAQACRIQYRLCLQYTPWMQTECDRIKSECLSGCEFY